MIEQNACKYRVKAAASDFTRLMATADFRQILAAECEIPSPCFNAVVTGFLLDGASARFCPWTVSNKLQCQ